MALLPSVAPDRRAVRRVGPERSDRQADRHDPAPRRDAGRHRLPRRPSASAPRRGGVTLVVDADPLRPRPLRLRQRQLADPAGRDPAAHHHPTRPSAAARRRRADRRARAGARARARLPAQRRLLRGDRPPGRAARRARTRAPSICTSPSTRGRRIRSGRSPSPATARCRPRTIDLMFRHAAWYFAWLRPVPFTQKQLRLDIDALEKRYRELGYFGVRVTTDFSMQRSLDRVAKNVRLAIQINERKKITVAFEGNDKVSSSTLRDELTLLSRGSYDDFEVGVQRRRHPALLPGRRLLLRARRLAPRAPVRRRGARRVHDRRGPAAARARHRVRRQQVAAGRRAGRGRVGAQVPAARASARAAT